jgi:hypothetical protein
MSDKRENNLLVIELLDKLLDRELIYKELLDKLLDRELQHQRKLIDKRSLTVGLSRFRSWLWWRRCQITLRGLISRRT